MADSLKNTILGWYDEGLMALSATRRECEKDFEFYEGDQWSEEDKRELEARGQPVLTLNFIKPTIDVVIGMETRVRADARILPRGDQDQGLADHLTAALKFEYDQNEVEYVFREAFENMVKGGVGWVLVEPNLMPSGGALLIESVPPEEIIYDPYAKRYDLLDGRYIIRIKWVRSAEAWRRWPEFARRIMSLGGEAPKGLENDQEVETIIHTSPSPDILGSVLQWQGKSGAGVYDKATDRVAVMEIQYRTVKTARALVNTATGEAVPLDDDSKEKIFSGWEVGETASFPVIREALVVGGQVLLDQEVDEAQGSYFKYVPLWAYRKRKGGHFGLIRQMRDGQVDLNKRAIKALHILNTVRVLAEEGALIDDQDLEQVRTEIARPDCLLVLARGALTNGAFKVEQNPALAHQQMLIAQQRRTEIQEVTGINMEMVGSESNAVSGRAILARQAQGSTILAPLFDNYRRSRRIVATLACRWIQRLYTPGMVIRITDEFGQLSSVTLGDISDFKYDVVVGETPFAETVRQTFTAELVELMRNAPPDMLPVLFKTWLRFIDVPQKDQILQELEAFSQQRAQAEIMRQDREALLLDEEVKNRGLDRLQKALKIFNPNETKSQTGMSNSTEAAGSANALQR